jgi:hypothetical protein
VFPGERIIIEIQPRGQAKNIPDNLGIGAKWQFFTNAPHELIISAGIDFDIGGTGAHQIAESFTTISPALFFGKGFGDLPESVKYLRPFAITGVIGPNFPTRSSNVSTNPDTGETVIEKIYRREEIFTGPFASMAPDNFCLEKPTYLFSGAKVKPDGKVIEVFKSSSFSGSHRPGPGRGEALPTGTPPRPPRGPGPHHPRGRDAGRLP